MEKIIVLALVLVVFMFATAIATAPVSIPIINNLDQILSIEGNVVPSGDPIDGGPPGLLAGDPIDGGPPGTLM